MLRYRRPFASNYAKDAIGLFLPVVLNPTSIELFSYIITFFYKRDIFLSFFRHSIVRLISSYKTFYLIAYRSVLISTRLVARLRVPTLSKIMQLVASRTVAKVIEIKKSYRSAFSLYL